MNKTVRSVAEAVADIGDGASVAVGGFGLCGIPNALIGGLYENGVSGLEVVSNNCGIPAFYTPAGVGTEVASGKQAQTFAGRVHVLEHAIETDYALVHAAWGDTAGNLVFHSSARNFNPLCAMAGRVTIAEVETLFEAGELDPDEIHLPGVFVQRVVAVGTGDKRIERRTVR